MSGGYVSVDKGIWLGPIRMCDFDSYSKFLTHSPLSFFQFVFVLVNVFCLAEDRKGTISTGSKF